MKTGSAAARKGKSGGVTLSVARQAAKVVKGDRPKGTFLVMKTGRSSALRDKYLGVIVHSPPKTGAGVRISSVKESPANTGVARRFAKKK
jgi:hypothetical protein